MRKADIIRQVVQTTGIETKDVEIVVEATISAIKRNVQEGRRVDLRGFGAFFPKVYRAKKARRPLNGCGLKRSEVIHVPDRVKPAFKPSKKYFQCTT